MNKRGGEDILMTVGYIVILVAAYFALAYWITATATGEFTAGKSIVKQVAILIDSAEPGTEIFIDKSINILRNTVFLNTAKYSFFNRHRVSAVKFEGGTKITIENG